MNPLALLSVAGQIFSSKGAAQDVLDVAQKTIDLIQDPTEKQKIQSKAADQMIEWLRATSGSRIARRYLAVNTFRLYAGGWLLHLVVAVASPWLPEQSGAALLISNQTISEAMREMTPLVGLVFGFYFGGPVATDITKNVVSRFTSK